MAALGDIFAPGLPTILRTITSILIVLILYLSASCVYRLYFHPLSQVPGPKLAAISRLNEFYHDCVRPGQYFYEIRKYHDKHGSFIRGNQRRY